jgi:uncharacterized LabA/DUF88 family protein
LTQPELEATIASLLITKKVRFYVMSLKSNRLALFIDGANLHATARTLGFEIDYKRLLK